MGQNDEMVRNTAFAYRGLSQDAAKEHNLTWHTMDIDRKVREQMLGQHAVTIWLTGLSGSGKSTVANALEQKLAAMGKHTMLLDGDNVRMGLNSNLGFSDIDRVENIRRIAEVSKLLNDAGIIVITAFISPFHMDRRNACRIIGDSFFEVYVSTSLEECERRDVKGLYERARKGDVKNFTGISSPYEIPREPDVVIDTEKMNLESCVNAIIEGMEAKYV